MTNYRTDIDAAAAAYGLDADLVAALVEQESGYRFHAYRYEPDFYARYLANNPAYAGREPREVSASYGLMQIMYPTAVDNGFTGEPWDLFAPLVSLEQGCLHLSNLLAWAHGNVRTALAAYNAGKGGANSAVGQTYARQVLSRYDRIRVLQ